MSKTNEIIDHYAEKLDEARIDLDRAKKLQSYVARSDVARAMKSINAGSYEDAEEKVQWYTFVVDALREKAARENSLDEGGPHANTQLHNPS